MKFRAITASLNLRTASHVGTGEGTETVDDLVRRDNRGRFMIPGTAIAGALRSIATRLAPRLQGEVLCQAISTNSHADEACGCLVCVLFGDVNPQAESAASTAARILVYDAVAKSTEVQIRDGVGIERVTGAAAREERAKFELEVLPAGITFELRIEIDRRLAGAPKEQVALQLLAASLAEWEQGRGAIGGRVARGLGAFDLTNVNYIEQDLNSPDILLNVVRNGPWQMKNGDGKWIGNQVKLLRPSVKPLPEEQHSHIAKSWATASFTLTGTGPFLTHDLVQAGRSGFDHAPVLQGYQKDAKPVLPGSSIRGVLRSQAERIARTLATFSALKAADPHDDFRQHCPACDPLAGKTDRPLASCSGFIKILTPDERRKMELDGAEEKLCLACQLFGSTWNGSRLRVEDAPFNGTEVTYKVLDFLAIDRFTGGGRDSAKYDAVVLWKPSFHVRIFLENPEPWELGWLALVLRDLHDHLITVGFGRSKGFGECELSDLKLTIGILDDTDFPTPISKPESNVDEVPGVAMAADMRLLASKGPESGLYQTVVYDPVHRDEWLDLANGWVRDFNDAVASHTSPHRRNNDSYFSDKPEKGLTALYPARVP